MNRYAQARCQIGFTRWYTFSTGDLLDAVCEVPYSHSCGVLPLATRIFLLEVRKYRAMMTKKNGGYDIDTAMMRVIASFFVVLIHASGIQTISEIFCNSISRFSVPVFVIISGYYMLPHKKDIRSIVRKSLRLFALMIAWSGLYFCYELICKQREQVVLLDILTYLLTEPAHLWYFYAAITLYLFTPFLHVFCKNATREEWRYALALSFFLGSFVVTALRFGISPMLSAIVDRMKVPYTLGFTFLYLLGGYLHKYFVCGRRIRITLYFLGVLGVVTTFVGTLLLPKYGFQNDLLLSFFAPNVMVPAVAFFVFVRQFFGSHMIQSIYIRRLLHRAADATLGIYLFHPFLFTIIQKNTLYQENVGVLIILLRALIVWLVSALIVDAARKIPALRKLV